MTDTFFDRTYDAFVANLQPNQKWKVRVWQDIRSSSDLTKESITDYLDIGLSMQEIADRYGITRQAVHNKHAYQPRFIPLSRIEFELARDSFPDLDATVTHLIRADYASRDIRKWSGIKIGHYNRLKRLIG